MSSAVAAALYGLNGRVETTRPDQIGLRRRQLEHRAGRESGVSALLHGAVKSAALVEYHAAGRAPADAAVVPGVRDRIERGKLIIGLPHRRGRELEYRSGAQSASA